ncbi:MAG: glycosyltransferase [Lachnospiraceae bacterium]|nr:glycosyltransferase [Lachnospiraceae bacterium]
MVTIFTPVYNRSYIIDQLYASLQRQNDTNFEWIIIDDGSTDNLKEKVQAWIKEDNPFKIYYEYVSHGGKHRAINRAVRMAKGEFFFIVDSDDYLSEDAVNFIIEKFSEVIEDDGIAAVSGLKAHYDGTVIGGNPKIEVIDALAFEARQYGMGGDKAEVYKTDLLKKYPFSEYEGEFFLPEGTVWNRIALDGYKIRYYNKIIYYAEYRSDGLSKNAYRNLVNSPMGWAESLRIWQKCGASQIDRSIIHYCYLYSKLGKEKICQSLNVSSEKYEQYMKINIEFDECMEHLLDNEGIKSVAIYGCGLQAHYFMNHLRNLGREIIYGLDRSVKIFEGHRVYSLEDDIPDTEAVFITVRNLSMKHMQEICSVLHSKLPGVKIWSLQEINNNLW